MRRPDQNQECLLARPAFAVWNVLKNAWMCFPSWVSVPRAGWAGSSEFILIRVRFLRLACVWPLSSVDTEPTREGTQLVVPGGPHLTAAHVSIASPINTLATLPLR